MQSVLDHELTQCGVVGHIGCDHHIFKTVGHVDEVLHGDNFAQTFIFHKPLKDSLQYNEFVYRQVIYPICEVCQLLNRGSIQPQTHQLGKHRAGQYADLVEGVRDFGKPHLLECVPDLMTLRREHEFCHIVGSSIRTDSTQLDRHDFLFHYEFFLSAW